MPSLALYVVTFTFYFAASVCTLTSLFLPNWITYNSTSQIHIHLRYGLTKHCSSYSQTSHKIDSSIIGTCESFPSESDCTTSPELCHSWRSAAFLVVVATALEGISFIAFMTVFNGGYARRQSAWKLLSFLMFLIGAAQLPSTLLTLHELKRNELFALQGWRVGASWVLATTSYALAWVGGIVVGVLGKFSPDEYTLIRNLDWA